MKKETLKRIFEFLEAKEEHNAPLIWKHMNNIPLTEEDLNVKGDLNLYKSNITSLPEGLNVGRDLDIFGSKITSLPKGLKVHRGLQIFGTELKKYTDEELREMVKPGFIGRIFR